MALDRTCNLPTVCPNLDGKACFDVTCRNSIVRQVAALEDQAHRSGLHVTAHALNCAKNALGWEVAGNVEMAGKAARGERPGEQ